MCFDFFYQRKAQIEADFGGPLVWERMEDRVSCRIKSQLDGVSLYEKEDWDKMITYMNDVSERMVKAFRNPVKLLNRKIKAK